MQQLQPKKEILIDGQKYVVQLYAPTFGLTLYAKLIRLLGEPLLKLFSMFKGKDVSFQSLLQGKLDNMDIDAAGDAVGMLLSKLKDEDFVPLIQEILSSTYLSPSLTPVNDVFETHFMGRYNHVFKLVAKSLGAQYPDFLSGIVKRSSAVKSAQASEAPEKARA